MLTTEQKQQHNLLLSLLAQTLDISESEFGAAVKSYQAVGRWLSKEGSVLAPYRPQIRPQGSFMLGTMIKTVNESDDLDIDLVCQLRGKRANWTQYDLKQAIGDQLKSNEMYRKMLKSPDGRRCWTLGYAESSSYHMDILPCLVSEGYQVLLEKKFSANDATSLTDLAMRITDKLERGYRVTTDPKFWLLSNPFGYGLWFFQRASLEKTKNLSMTEAVSPVPKYQKEKLPLQQAVQMMKRHRDVIFDGDEDKPISIIITTLAALAYNKEATVFEALQNIVYKMPSFIEERFDVRYGKRIKWIANPINNEENFADKWPLNPQKQKNFYHWMDRLQADLSNITNQRDMYLIHESVSKSFGERTATKVFNTYGDEMRRLRESGQRYMAAKTGILGSVGTIVRNHNFHGTSK